MKFQGRFTHFLSKLDSFSAIEKYSTIIQWPNLQKCKIGSNFGHKVTHFTQGSLAEREGAARLTSIVPTSLDHLLFILQILFPFSQNKVS
jgi:hypothetical protein